MKFYLFQLVLGFPLFLLSSFSVCASKVKTMDLDLKSWKHVSFSDDIKSCRYENDKNKNLVIQVKDSSSFLLHPFESVETISNVYFEWKSEGEFKVTSHKQQTSKAGDDFRIRIGIIKSGPKPWVPFFAPGWVKLLRESMKLPTNSLLYIVASDFTPAGTRWTSPYSDSIDYISVPASHPKTETKVQGWIQSSLAFSPPVSTVGLWIMADGDNSHSEFNSRLHKLELTTQ